MLCVFFPCGVTWEQVGAPPKALPVEQTQRINIHLLQCCRTVSEVQSSTQNLWSHVPHRPHLQIHTPISLLPYLTPARHHHHLTSDMATVSSSPWRPGRFPVSFMDRPKSASTQDKSARTRTFLPLTSLWATAGLYWSEGTEEHVIRRLLIT